MPNWLLFGFAAFLVVVVVLSGRAFLALWRRNKHDPRSLDEPWDPFA
jgi:hypothetical protein